MKITNSAFTQEIPLVVYMNNVIHTGFPGDSIYVVEYINQKMLIRDVTIRLGVFFTIELDHKYNEMEPIVRMGFSLV